MIEHRRFPSLQRAVRFQDALQAVRAESAECDREKTKSRRRCEKENGDIGGGSRKRV